ncbi:hypothetical protein [Geoglobus ahangari]
MPDVYEWLRSITIEYCPYHKNVPLQIVDITSVPSEHSIVALGWCDECGEYYQILFEVKKVLRLAPKEVEG